MIDVPWIAMEYQHKIFNPTRRSHDLFCGKSISLVARRSEELKNLIPKLVKCWIGELGYIAIILVDKLALEATWLELI